MNAQLKTKWIEALRSDEFKQNVGSIGGGKELCCIGVGGVVAGVKQVPSQWWTAGVAQCLGLSSDQEMELVSMNDHENKSFREIADYIEKNL